jgi:hypothetical protein
MRIEGWERRLVDIIEAARHVPYELGVHDCFRLACRVVQTLTGVDRWPEFAGYRTEREALAALAAYGSSFVTAGDRFFGTLRQPTRYARRGDILGYQDDSGKWHLGVCLGAEVALLGPGGLTFAPVSTCDCVWRIG